MKEQARKLEKDIIKKYRKDIWSKFIKGIKTFKLLQDGDKVMVAISGGKDSLLLAKLFQELKKHPLVDFDVVFVLMDPGYSNSNIELIKYMAKNLNIDIKIEPYNIFKVVNNISKDYPCYMCARMRRGFLYSMAEKYECNKMALGHHFDDVIETTLLNLFYSGSFKTMLPKVSSKNFEGIDLIRPMYFIKEKNVRKVMENNDIYAMDCGCDVAAGRTASKREEIKKLIKTLKETHQDIDKSIFRAAANVNLDNILAWEKDGEKYHFDDE
ncbi:MAG: tRNA 2-thiocytidine biosynthesis TtcA family protein [Bacillota bacterium]